MLDQDEITRVNCLRNAVAYGGVKNSIVEWMNSPEWTQPSKPMRYRGEVELSGALGLNCDEITGEISNAR